MSKEQTPILTDGFKPPFRVGRKLQRAIVDSKGRELQTFNEGLEELAQMVCDMLNGTYCKSKLLEALEEKSKTAESILETLNDMHSNDEINYDRYTYLFNKVASIQLDETE